MGRGDESVKRQVETDLAASVDAWRALVKLQEWSLVLAGRRWRAADGETFQGYIQRVESGLAVVHRWMRLLRRWLPTLDIETLLEIDQKKPAKRDSASTG